MMSTRLKIEIQETTELPRNLSQIYRAPKKLYFVGDINLLGLPSLSIVGTRRPSHYGVSAALQFSRALASAGLVIISGLARGIDSSAHRGALLARGKTVAVLGHGLNQIYPRENLRLAHEIVENGGCLISEYPEGTPPLPHHFPERNRIISGLSWGTLVIEAAEKSGSLITARLAMEQSREVFVLPARCDEVSFIGGHKLIQEGAKLVTRAEEILVDTPDYWQLEVLKGGVNEKTPLLAQTFKARTSFSLSEIYGLEESLRGKCVKELLGGISEGRIHPISGQNFVWTE